MASLPANTTPATLMHTFYTTACATVTFDNGVNNVNITPSMFFGLYRAGNATDRLYSNWLNQRINQIVTALAIRPTFTAPTIGPLPVEAHAFANNAAFNPYLFLSGLTEHNRLTLTNFVRSLGAFIQDKFPTSKPLRAYTQPGDLAVCRHLIFDFPVPTWSTQDPTPAEARFAVPLTYNTHDAFAAAISFATAPADPVTAPDGVNNFYTAARLRNPDPAVDHLANMQVVDAAAPAPGTADPVSWVLNMSAQNPQLRSLSLPECRIFDPTVGTSTHLAAVIVAGLIIEIYDISSVSVILARPTLPLNQENSLLIAGAIPLSQIRTALQDGTPFSFRRTSHPAFPRFLTGFTQGPAGQLRLGFLRQGIVETDSTRGLTRANTRFFPGASILASARRIGSILNYFGLTVGENAPQGMPTVHLWSSYRYQSQVPGNTTIYMLPSLRPLFGLRARHFHSAHPAERIP